MFAVPTYFFIVNMVILIIVGIYKWATGTLHVHAIPVGHGRQSDCPHRNLGEWAPARCRAVRDAAGIRVRGVRTDRYRGDLERRERVPTSRGRNARITMVLMAVILGSLVSGVSVPASRHAPSHALRVGHAHRHLTDRQFRLRHVVHRPPLLRAAPDRHHAHPDAGGQHQFHRVPVPGQLRRRGLVPAPPADQTWPPPRLLHRDHRAHRRGPRAAAHHPGQGGQADPALRHRRVHRVHHGRRRYGKYHLTHREDRLAPSADRSTGPRPSCPPCRAGHLRRRRSSAKVRGSSSSSCRWAYSSSSGCTASTWSRRSSSRKERPRRPRRPY